MKYISIAVSVILRNRKKKLKKIKHCYKSLMILRTLGVMFMLCICTATYNI